MATGEATLKIEALRSGSVKEVVSFLSDLNGAYIALETMEQFIRLRRHRGYRVSRTRELGYWELDLLAITEAKPWNLDSEELPPNLELRITRVTINSPGFWETIGQLNPVQQLREYLNERHERQKDIHYRNRAESERLRLENELLVQKIWNEELGRLGAELALLREVGIDEHYLQTYIFNQITRPLSRLGRHQDSGLIGRTLDN